MKVSIKDLSEDDRPREKLMKYGAEEAGRMYGSSGDFAMAILAYFEANCGTKEKAG